MNFKITLILLASCLLSLDAQADDVEYVELKSRFSKWHTIYKINEDYTVERVSELEVKALTDDAANDLKKRHFSHSTSIEKFEVLEAYTVKSDGRKIKVPEDNYQVTINKGNKKGEAIFSDRTKITVVFPEMEKNDSVFMKVKNVETEPMFPKNFSFSEYYWDQIAYDDVKIIIDLPQDMKIRYKAMKMEKKEEVKDGRKLIVLTYDNKSPIKTKRENYSVWNESEEAGFSISSFEDYEAIANAYGERALPKAKPTERVKILAEEIVGGERDEKQMARLLYEWVATNISYAGNCIGVGAVVPHDTDFILDNRIGDCKDHAILLQALLSAVGIESTQALINSGSSYALPEIPMVSSVNHVLNYIPEWDKFVDSTNPSMPFDRLSFNLSDKPVLLVDGFREGLKTPATKIGENNQEVDSTMKIQADGSVVGNVSVKLRGYPAIDARARWRHTTKEQENEWLKAVFSSQNRIGSATLTKDDPVPLLSEFQYSLEFNRPDFILPKGAGGFYISPPLDSPMSIYAFLSYPREDIEGYEVACSNGYSVERLVYEFPENMKILAKPDNFAVTENNITFNAEYDINGQKLTVVREIRDETPGNVCSAESTNRTRQTLMKISDHLQGQVIYQH